jgi:hypothetical protein
MIAINAMTHTISSNVKPRCASFIALRPSWRWRW